MGALQACGGLLHSLNVELAPYMPDNTPSQSAWRSPV